MDRPRKSEQPRQRANFHADPASLDVPAHQGGAGEARPLPFSQVDPFYIQRWRLEVYVLLDLTPDPYLPRDRVHYARVVRGIHALLLAHHGLASRLIVYQHLDRFLPPRKASPSVMPKGFWNPPFRTLDQRHRTRVRKGLSEGKSLGLWRRFDLDPDAPDERVPGGRCPVCRLHLSPGDLACLRDAGECSGGSSTQE